MLVATLSYLLLYLTKLQRVTK